MTEDLFIPKKLSILYVLLFSYSCKEGEQWSAKGEIGTMPEGTSRGSLGVPSRVIFIWQQLLKTYM
jgi:hypothetical protein